MKIINHASLLFFSGFYNLSILTSAWLVREEGEIFS